MALNHAFLTKRKQGMPEAEAPAVAKKFKLRQAQKASAEGGKGKASIVVDDDLPTGIPVQALTAGEKGPTASPVVAPAPAAPITLTLVAPPDPSAPIHDDCPEPSNFESASWQTSCRPASWAYASTNTLEISTSMAVTIMAKMSLPQIQGVHPAAVLFGRG